MSVYRHYNFMSREEADKNAINDIKEYLSENQWNILQEISGEIIADKTSIYTLNFAMGLAGVSGYPFHAFCRKYCLKQYREWMGSGNNAVMTDEQGFPLEGD